MLRMTLLTLCAGTFAAALPVYADDSDTAQRAQNVNDVIVRSGVLTPKGKWSLDTSLNYSQNSSNKVSVVGYTVLPTLIIGRIEVSDSDRTTITLGITGRYGLTEATELEMRVPFVYRNDQISTRPIQDGAQSNIINTTVDGGGLGDIEFALRHQFNFDSPPYWIGGVRLKTDTGRSPYDVSIDPGSNSFSDVPTGSGLWSIEPSLSFVHPADPAVLFANISYIYNLSDNVRVGDTLTEIELGDTISVGAGFGFAVNPDFSFTLGLSHKTIMKSTVDGSEPEDAKLLQLDSITLGTNYSVTDTTSLNVSVQAGLTEDTPDFQLTVRVPINL